MVRVFYGVGFGGFGGAWFGRFDEAGLLMRLGL